jgi:hypothetical protein
MALKPLNSVAGFSVGEIPAPIILANGDITARNAIFSGNLLISNSSPTWGVFTDNLYYSNGTSWDLQQAAGSNTQVQFNNNDNFGASANFTFNTVTGLLTLIGNVDIGYNLTAGFVYANSNVVANNITANSNISVTNTLLANSVSANANVLANNINANANVNVTNTVLANFVSANANIVASNISANVNTVTNSLTVNTTISGNTANFTGNINSALNANLGNLVTANYVNVASNIISNNVTVNLLLSGNTANFTGNITSLNANLGNLATANYVNVASNVITSNLTVNLAISGNTANFTGNITSLNANLGNLATANYVNVANDLNVLGNITGANIVGALANGNSNVKVYSNANIEFTVSGVSNVASFTQTGFLVVGNINSTAGNITANGNVIANGFINATNANVTGGALLGSVTTSVITANGGNITISAAGSDNSIILQPTGIGTVDVNGARVTQLSDPTEPNDAATKEYVDNTAQGLQVHTPVQVTSVANLNAIYTQGGTLQTTTTITGNDTISFSANHGLSVGDEIVWTNTFNGITGGESYYVYSIPAPNAITIKNGYFGVEVTTLTNGSGLSESSRANSGVGAKLTNAGAFVAIQIDSILLSVGDRILVQGQTTGAQNGIYEVTITGNVSTAWEITRTSDADTYGPKQATSLAAGDYFFVEEGVNYAGSSYVLSQPAGEIIFGTTSIVFTQFSAAGSYTAGSGINIVGTTISANTDGVTTGVVGGNIVVIANAQFTTPNIGAATGTSLTVTGNVGANNFSITSNANITLDLTVGNIIQSTGNINSNANVNSNNLHVTNFVQVGANILANNISANSNVSAVTISASGNVIANNVNVNLALSGNTANFTSTLAAGATTINGNLLISNANASWGVKTDHLYYSNGQPWDMQEAAGSNTQIQFNDGNNNFGASANLTFDTSTDILKVSGTANISNAVVIGNTTIAWGTVTTSAITANQTISSVPISGITGVQFLVKAVDVTGAKYSVATVQAVTDGASSVDYATYGTVNLGGYTGTLAVNISGGYLRLQVTPASGNSTVWTTQYNYI